MSLSLSIGPLVSLIAGELHVDHAADGVEAEDLIADRVDVAGRGDVGVGGAEAPGKGQRQGGAGQELVDLLHDDFFSSVVVACVQVLLTANKAKEVPQIDKTVLFVKNS